MEAMITEKRILNYQNSKITKQDFGTLPREKQRKICLRNMLIPAENSNFQFQTLPNFKWQGGCSQMVRWLYATI